MRAVARTSSNWTRRGLLILKLAVAAVLVWWLVSSGQMDFSQFRGVGSRWEWILAGIGACGIVQVVTVWRWTVLLRVQGIRYRYAQALRISMIGLFFNQFMLGSVGGDLYKVYAVVKDHPGAKSAGMVSVLVDRITGLVMSLLLVPMALLFTWDFVMADGRVASLVGLVVAILVGSAVFGLCLISLRLRRIGVVRRLLDALPMQERLKRIDQAIRVHAEHPREMVWVTISGLTAQVFVVLTNVCLAYALVPDLDSVAIFFLLIPLALITMALPINPPGAVGTGEAIYQYLLSLGGFASGSLLSLLQRGVLMLWAVPGAFLYVAGRGPGDAVALPAAESSGDA